MALAIFSSNLTASEIRQFEIIPTPGAAPEGARSVDKVRPVARELVEEAARRTVAAWNTPHLEEVLHEDMFDRERLMNSIDTLATRDARLRLLSVGAVQTVQQFTKPRRGGGRILISRVSAVLQTQLEYNDPATGFQRLPLSDEFVFEFRQLVR
jgi:hypothetical protein